MGNLIRVSGAKKSCVSEYTGDSLPHVVNAGRDDYAGIDPEHREYENKIQYRSQETPEICERGNENYPEERNLCHVGEGFRLVNFTEI